jgi:hypothetical protein
VCTTNEQNRQGTLTPHHHVKSSTHTKTNHGSQRQRERKKEAAGLTYSSPTDYNFPNVTRSTCNDTTHSFHPYHGGSFTTCLFVCHSLKGYSVIIMILHTISASFSLRVLFFSGSFSGFITCDGELTDTGTEDPCHVREFHTMKFANKAFDEGSE